MGFKKFMGDLAKKILITIIKTIVIIGIIYFVGGFLINKLMGM